MQVITAPISRDEPRDNRAAILANLQTALLLLLRGGAIPGGGERQQFFEDGLQREQREHLYADITQKLVTLFQEQFRQRPELVQPFFLIVTGNVDAATAEVMNRRLFEIHALRSAEGSVKNRDGSPVVGNLLFAFDKENIGGAFLGSANTNADGAYHIFYDPLLYARAGDGVLKVKDVIDLIIQVYDAGGATLAESQPLHDPAPKVRVDLTIGDTLEKQPFILRGQVVNASGPINGIQVSAFDRDLFFRRDGANTGQQLGNEITKPHPTKNEDGWFEFTYATSDFSVGDVPIGDHPIPDLIFALSRDAQALEKFQIFRLPDGEELVEETLVSDDDLILGVQARKVEEVRIVVAGGEPRRPLSEYERLIQAIEPLLPERAPAGEDEAQREAVVGAAVLRFDEEKHRDVSFVARETGLNQFVIQALVAAFRLAVDPFQHLLPASVFYGLARTRAAFDLLALARLSTEELQLALKEATTGAPPFIPPFVPAERLEQSVRTIRDVLANRVPNYRSADDAPSLADLVGAELPDAEDQATLWRSFSDHKGTPAEFWEKLRSEPGFGDPDKVAKVQYSFQLGMLTRNNIPLVNAIRAEHPNMVSTSELAFELDTQEKWTALLDSAAVLIPDDVPGKPEERKANYAASLAGAMQIAHPTVAVANMVASLPPVQLANTQPAVAKFLADAVRQTQFDLVTGRINDLVAAHGESLLETIDLKDRPVVIAQVKRLQRLFRLSSGPESMKALVNAGFSSARDLAELPPEVAMEILTPVLGEATSRMMLDRANNIAAGAIHQYVLLNDAINSDIPGGAI